MQPDRPNTRELERVERLARVEVKLDVLCEKIDALNECLDTTVIDHEKRLARIERVVWVEAGLFLLFGVPLILMLMFELIQRLF